MKEPAGTPDRPFVGLQNYTEEDAALFFGRGPERHALLGNLRTSRFTLLYAQSGAGKSSLLRAGVVSRLRELGDAAQDMGLPRFIPVIVSSWSGDPIVALRDAVLAAAYNVDGSSPEPRATGRLDETIETAARSTGARFLIILDQFEEYFAHQGDELRPAFAEAIGRCVTRLDLPVNFLVSIREDAYASLGTLFKARVPNVYGNYLRLLPLDVRGAEEAIRKPLELFGVTPEDELVDQVLAGVRQSSGANGSRPSSAEGTSDDGEYVAAPYLQLVMSAVWAARGDPESHALRTETLKSLGGTEEIIQSHVSSALELPERQKDIAAAALRYLAPSDRGKLTLTVRHLAEFTGYSGQELAPVLAHLDDQRILAAGDTADSYELFHDVLARHIVRWRTDYERDRQTRAEREEKDKRLRAEARAREEEAAKLKAQWLVRILIGVVILALLGAGVAIILTVEDHLNQQRHTAQSEQLAASAAAISDLGLASLFALESFRISHTTDAQSAILQIGGSHEIGTPLVTADQGIESVAWGRDERTLATAGADGTVGVWDVASRRDVARIAPPSPLGALRGIAHLGVIGTSIGAVAFSADGRRLAYGENLAYYDSLGNPQVLATIRLWDVRSRQPLAAFTGHTDRINALAFSPDGTELASASDDKTVRLWHVSGHLGPGKVLRGHTGAVSSVAFSPNGKLLASSSCDRNLHEDTGDDSVLLWDTRRDHLAARLRGQYPVCSVAFSRDNNTLAAASDGQSITLWDVRRHQPVGLPLVGDTDVLNGVAFSPDGKVLASASRDHTVRLWDVAQHRQLGAPLRHAGAADSVAFNPGGRTLASAGSDGVRVWSVAGPYQLGALPTTHGAAAVSVAFSPDGRTLAWTDGYPRKSSDGKLVHGTVYLWDMRGQRLLPEIPAPTDNVNSLTFDPRGKRLAWAASDDHSVWVWDLERNRRVSRILAPNPNTVIRRVAISPDGNTLAFDDTNGRRSTIRLWDLRHSRYLPPLSVGTTGELGGLAFSPDSQILASAGIDGAVRLWDLRAERQLGRPLRASGAPVYDVAFSPDGKTVASGGGDGAIRFWDVARHRERGAPLTEDTAAVYSVAFGPDGKTLASASLDGTVRLWDATAQRALVTLTGHTSYVFGVAYSPDGRTLASAGGDGTVRLWGGFNLDSAISRLCTYINQRAAPRLWHQFEPSIDFRQPCP